MINLNKEDRIEMAQEIAKIRDIGCVNMFDRFGVAEALYCEGFDYTAEYISNHREDYLELLTMSSEY